MKKISVVMLIVIASIALTAGVVKAASAVYDSLTVGKQGSGGVTFFNGSIINNTTGTGGTDNPVVIADNLRIDGRVYRGATAGTGDSQPFIVNDNMEVAGTLTIGGNAATTKTVLSGTITMTASGDEAKVMATGIDCGSYPTYTKSYTYHYKKIAVPQVDMASAPDLRVFLSLDDTISSPYPSIADSWVSAGYLVSTGYVYVNYKSTTTLCDDTSTDSYNTTGNYRVVIIN
ncbi:MAG: hypothetical protein WC544_02700 [Patescibacteria group bacterium]